jgi:hypothetical protein
MRKLAPLLLLLLCLQSTAQRVGIKAGVALASFAAESNRLTTPNAYLTNYSVSSKPGIVLGSFVDFRLRDNLVLRPGVDVVAKGGVENGLYHSGGIAETYRERKNFAAVDFPLLLLWQAGNKGGHGLQFGAGLVPGILIEGGLNKGDLAAAITAGYRFRSGLEYNLSYNYGLVDVATYYSDYRTLKNRHLALTVGYRFGRPTSPRGDPAAVAQQPETAPKPARALFAELGGSGGFLSVNYDTRLTKSHKGWGIRAGIGAITDLNSTGLTVPVGLNYLAGEKNHFFEMGLGATYFRFSEQNQDSWFSFSKLSFVAPHVWMGYRYQPVDKRFVFRGGLNQYVASGLSGFIAYPFPGFSFGYSIR